MKKILKNSLFGALIGLLNVPILLIELYYFGGNKTYLLEVVAFENLQRIICSTVLYGFGFSIVLTLPTFLNESKLIKNVDVKNVLKVCMSAFLIIIMLPVIPYFKLSESVNSLIILNTIITFILIMIPVFVYNSIQIQKINKKIKE